MTWIKPSFLWLMARSQWGHRTGQERTLAIRISREGWEEALAEAVLTHPEKGIYRGYDDWLQQFEEAKVHVQWDPERSLRGTKLNYRSIQVGIGRELISRFVEEWIIEIRDISSLVAKVNALRQAGRHREARRLLPIESKYPTAPAFANSLG